MANTATCPKDGEPLIMTFETPGKEFLCMVCGVKYEFFGPIGVEPTPELNARYNELFKKFQNGERPEAT